MKVIATYRRQALIISVIVIIVFLFNKCIGGKDEDQEAKQGQFAGSAVCASCHNGIYKSHLKTAHYLTSQPADSGYIKGSFETGRNVFAFSNSAEIKMEKRDDGFYEVAYMTGAETQRMRFDIVIGSGTKGQGYLGWVKNQLFQLPISYFTAANEWSNTPGRLSNVPFSRPITSRCLECHSTYFHKISEPNKNLEEFDHKNIQYGVDCEKCHGPASKHVEFEMKNPGDTTGKYIINPAHFSRQQNLDLCALCHGGRLKKSRPSFEYKSGDKLSDYFAIDTAGRYTEGIDVHGNQLGLLAASKCFGMSQMTCVSCHNIHENEKGKTALFSSRCMNCHSAGHGKVCGMTAEIGTAINQNCIDCHMPSEKSRSIVVFLQGAELPTPTTLRTHLIKIYPDETKQVLMKMRQLNKENKK
jgi:hypothetical protein